MENYVGISLISLLGFESLDSFLAPTQQLTAWLWTVERLFMGDLAGRGGMFLVLEAQTLSLTLKLEPDSMAVLCQEDHCCAPGSRSKQLCCWTWLLSDHLQHSPGAGFKCPSQLDCFHLSSEGSCVLRSCFSWIHSSQSPWTTAWHPVSFMLFLALDAHHTSSRVT